jgi:hypothetical protein
MNLNLAIWAVLKGVGPKHGLGMKRQEVKQVVPAEPHTESCLTATATVPLFQSSSSMSILDRR